MIEVYYQFIKDLNGLELEPINLHISNYLNKKISINNNIQCEIIFCSNQYIKKLNLLYRLKNQTTDVLSFPIWNNLSKIPSSESPIDLGSIVINADLIPKISVSQKKTISKICLDLILHSLDHLVGKHHPE